MKKFKLFIHVNNNQSYKLSEIDTDEKIGFLVRDFAPEQSQQPDFMEDVEVYLEDQNDDFNKGLSIEESGIKNGDHIFVGRCKRVSVTINYAGHVYTVSVSPSTSMKTLKHKAIHHFKIDEVTGADLSLWLGTQPLEARIMIGSLTGYPNCSVSLILASKNDINGDLSQELFCDHLNSPEFQSGEIDGKWGINDNGNGPQWPISIIWVQSSTGERIDFKFDFTGYPNAAPTAIIWDTKTGVPLAVEKRPNKTKRANQVFKVWGKECNYLPCDRMAFEGHTDWPNIHPSLVWNSGHDTLIKYLNELHEILNP